MFIIIYCVAIAHSTIIWFFALTVWQIKMLYIYIYTGWPKKVSYYQLSSLNRI